MPRNEQEINVLLILEVLGRPKEHILSALTGLIEQLNKEKGVKVLAKNIKEPRELKQEEQPAQAQQQELYVTFAEVEIQVTSLFDLVGVMFKYMPSHVEIISPEDISSTNADWNDMLNDLTRRLHAYDEVARVMQMENAILKNQLKIILEQQKKHAEEHEKHQHAETLEKKSGNKGKKQDKKDLKKSSKPKKKK